MRCRRDVLKATLAASSMFWANKVLSSEACSVMTSESQAQLTPDEVLKRLMEGNQRFVSGQTLNCHRMQQIRATARSQAPMAAIVGCIDSRVPPEIVFDQQIGDIFSARIAGNYVNDDIIGSLEFATQLAGAKTIVVLGHSECGAVKGAIDGAELGWLTGVLAQIRPSLDKLNYQGVPSSKNAELVQRVAEQNVRDAIDRLRQRSKVLPPLEAQGRLKIAGALHDVGTGQMRWLT